MDFIDSFLVVFCQFLLLVVLFFIFNYVKKLFKKKK